MRKRKYPDLRKAMALNYGLILTPKQLERLAKDPRERHDLKIDSTDTAVRETFSTLVVWDVLGRGRYWPCNGEGSEAGEKFFLEFYPAAVKAGYQVASYVLANLEVKRRVRIQKLKNQISDTQAELKRLQKESKTWVG